MIKKTEDLDYYELLGLRFDASLQEVRNAYILAVATYHEDALASYGVLTGEERRSVLDRIEEAFRTLGDPGARKNYDTQLVATKPEYQRHAYFRSSVERVEIEDADGQGKVWERLKSRLTLSRLSRKKADGRSGNDHGDWRALQRSHFYYGEYLKRVREERGLTLEDAALSCRLSSEELRALEDEDHERFSDRTEVYRLLRRYARCLGLDSPNGD
jgi:DnaJ-class molecular chaperone